MNALSKQSVFILVTAFACALFVSCATKPRLPSRLKPPLPKLPVVKNRFATGSIVSSPTQPITNYLPFTYPPGFVGTNYAIESTTNDGQTWQFELWTNGEKNPVIFIDRTQPKKFFRVRLP